MSRFHQRDAGQGIPAQQHETQVTHARYLRRLNYSDVRDDQMEWGAWKHLSNTQNV